MDLTVSGFTKFVTLTAIVAVFAVAGWRLGAPSSFDATLASVGLEHATPVTTTASADSSPSNSGDSSAGH